MTRSEAYATESSTNGHAVTPDEPINMFPPRLVSAYLAPHSAYLAAYAHMHLKRQLAVGDVTYAHSLPHRLLQLRIGHYTLDSFLHLWWWLPLRKHLDRLYLPSLICHVTYCHLCKHLDGLYLP